MKARYSNLILSLTYIFSFTFQKYLGLVRNSTQLAFFNEIGTMNLAMNATAPLFVILWSKRTESGLGRLSELFPKPAEVKPLDLRGSSNGFTNGSQ